MIWGWIKSYHRRNCTYNYSDLKNSLPNTVENKLPIAFIRRCSRRCERFMTGYQVGLDGPMLDYAMKKFKGHRNIPTESKDLIKREFEEKLNKSNKKRKID